MPRENISEEEILEWMNSELHKDEECEDVEFTSILKCEEDEQGCNWTVTNLTGHGTHPDAYKDRADAIVRQARELFNVI